MSGQEPPPSEAPPPPSAGSPPSSPPPSKPPPPSSPPPVPDAAPPPAPQAAAPGPQAALEDLRGTIMKAIQEQVKDLILQARQDSESKVKSELKIIYDAMKEMDSKLDVLMTELDAADQADPGSEPTVDAVENSAVLQALQKVEATWGQELRKIKQELHQTVFAHNHNADLMKHQKDALDLIKAKLAESNATPASPQLQQRLRDKVTALQQRQGEAARLEPLFARLVAVERVSAAASLRSRQDSLRATMGMSNLLAAQQMAQLQAAMNPQLAAAATALSAQQAMASARSKAKTGANKVSAKQQQALAAALGPSIEEVQAQFASMGPPPAAPVEKAPVRTPTKEELDAQLARIAETVAASKSVAPAKPRVKNPSNEELQEQLARVAQAAAANAKAKNPSDEEIQAQLAKIAAATRKEGA